MEKKSPQIEALEKAVEIAEKQAKLRDEQEREAERVKELRSKLKHYQRENNPLFRKVKKIGQSTGSILDNIEINRGKEKSGCEVNDRVMITNGDYVGKEMLIERFIVGGIEGKINDKIIRIRHGSYYKVLNDN